MRFRSGSSEDYNDASGRNKSKEKSDIVSGVPVAVLDSEYARATNAVMSDIETYTVLDVYDKVWPEHIVFTFGGQCTIRDFYDVCRL